MISCFTVFYGLLIFNIHWADAIDKRVIGGEIAPSDKYRWAVSIKGNHEGSKKVNVCGASVVKTTDKIYWLITAAHCFYHSDEKYLYFLTDPKLWTARAGLIKIDFKYHKHSFEEKVRNWFREGFRKIFKFKKVSSDPKDLHIKKIIIHPDYTPGRLENDIALMKLTEPLIIDQLKGINATELPDQSSNISWPPVDEKCVVVGWGCTQAKGRPSTIAKLAYLKIWNNEKCIDKFEDPIDLNPSSELCAGYLGKKYGLCSGDSGSGLVCDSKGTWKLAGVVSAVHKHRPGEYPAIFTRVSFFKDWIIKTTTEN